MRDKFKIRIMFLIIFSIITFIICSSIGRFELNAKDIVNFLLNKFSLSNNTIDNSKINVLETIRIPRMIGAFLIGMSLSVSGACYQAIFKNPLVSPDLLGVSQGACVGAALSIILGLSYVNTQIFALIGGLFAVIIATSIPKILKNDSTLMLVLSGVIVSGFMSSIIGLLKYLADDETELPAITYWQLGSLSTIRNTTILKIIIPMILALLLIFFLRWRINILSLGDDEAELVGIDVKKIRFLTVLSSTILTALSVCIAGTIGWVGLIIPHLSRLIVGVDNKKVIPTSIFLGASFMMIVDTLARSLTQAEIPLSIITGFIGAPLYLLLLLKSEVRLK
ncbi:MAG: iron ABC transporter permease [Tissierellia bacterium]|nr:iron ABC transporter permease [Tissierellia bacterium]